MDGLFGKYRVLLAPMAGVTDIAFRTLCREAGADMAFTEMVSAKGLSFANEKTRHLLALADGEKQVAVQLFGHEPDVMASQAAWIEQEMGESLAYLDINMGCPVPKVVNNGEGSALMKNPKLVGEIVKKVASSIQKPLTVKIRKGFTEDCVNAVEIAKIIEDAGAAAVAVHGRTREQYYSGRADWDIIRRVKEAVSIPVIGNGDVDSPKSAKRLLEETGCDGIMIGRAARGNPWIFSRIRSYLENGTMPDEPSSSDVREMILKHARLQLEYKGEYTGMREMRKHVAWYTAGMPHSASVRRKVNEIETYEQLEELVNMF